MPSPFHKHPRLPDRDYTKGKYFITINTSSRGDILGSIVGKDAEARMELNEAGLIVSECFQAIPIHHPNSRIAELQLMPDHLHAIVVLGSTVSMGPGNQGKALGEKISGSTQWVDGTGIQQEIGDGEEQSPRDGDADEMPNAPKGPKRGSLGAIMAVFQVRKHQAHQCPSSPAGPAILEERILRARNPRIRRGIRTHRPVHRRESNEVEVTAGGPDHRFLTASSEDTK
jgi:hypothetical protein